MTVQELRTILEGQDPNAEVVLQVSTSWETLTGSVISTTPGWSAARAGYSDHFLDEAGLDKWVARCGPEFRGSWGPAVLISTTPSDRSDHV